MSRPPSALFAIRPQSEASIFDANNVPNDAYVRPDFKQHWLASLAVTTIPLNLFPAIVGGRGKHRILVALAENNGVLYSAPTAAVSITVK